MLKRANRGRWSEAAEETYWVSLSIDCSKRTGLDSRSWPSMRATQLQRSQTRSSQPSGRVAPSNCTSVMMVSARLAPLRLAPWRLAP